MTVAELPNINLFKLFEITYRPIGFLRARHTRVVSRAFLAKFGEPDIYKLVTQFIELPNEKTTDFERVQIMAIRPVREGV